MPQRHRCGRMCGSRFSLRHSREASPLTRVVIVAGRVELLARPREHLHAGVGAEETAAPGLCRAEVEGDDDRLQRAVADSGRKAG